jgi:hypothetical protein
VASAGDVAPAHIVLCVQSEIAAPWCSALRVRVVTPLRNLFCRRFADDAVAHRACIRASRAAVATTLDMNAVAVAC